MPTWTISAPENFKKSVQKTAKKLGLSYGAYLRKTHRAYLETLSDKDFEKAKKLIELQESKERLGSLRERERVLLREKGYKNKNVQRIFKDIEDPEIRKDVERIAELREEEANKQLRLHDELNPTDEPEKQKMTLEEKRKRLQKALAKLKEEKEAEEAENKRDIEHRKQREKAEKKRKKERKRKLLEWKRKLAKNPKFGLNVDTIAYVQDYADEQGISFLKCRDILIGDLSNPPRGELR